MLILNEIKYNILSHIPGTGIWQTFTVKKNIVVSTKWFPWTERPLWSLITWLGKCVFFVSFDPRLRASRKQAFSVQFVELINFLPLQCNDRQLLQTGFGIQVRFKISNGVLFCLVDPPWHCGKDYKQGLQLTCQW